MVRNICCVAVVCLYSVTLTGQAPARQSIGGVLDTLAWADSSLYHAWRLADSLRIAAGK